MVIGIDLTRFPFVDNLIIDGAFMAVHSRGPELYFYTCHIRFDLSFFGKYKMLTGYKSMIYRNLYD